MPARLCPYCRELNGAGEARCYRCGRRLPGPLLETVLRLARDGLGVEAPMTRLILALQLAVFALCFIADFRAIAKEALGGNALQILMGSFRTVTLIRFGALGGGLGELEPWRLLSAVFVHVGLLHIVMNLFMLVDAGRQLESAIGGARFVVLFVVSGVLGFVASEIWYGFQGPVTAGASGAIFGEIGAIVGILRARRDPQWRRALVRYLVVAVILGLLLPVNTPAHLGGFLAGILLGFALYREQGRLRLNRLMLVLAGFSLLASVASVGLSAYSSVWRSLATAGHEAE